MRKKLNSWRNFKTAEMNRFFRQPLSIGKRLRFIKSARIADVEQDIEKLQSQVKDLRRGCLGLSISVLCSLLAISGVFNSANWHNYTFPMWHNCTSTMWHINSSKPTSSGLTKIKHPNGDTEYK